jgi:hypothetical protein
MIAVVHLVWGPLGVGPVREFVASYRAHEAGVDHELVVVANGVGVEGFDASLTEAGLLAELEGVEHRLIVLERPVLDLVAYAQAARLLEHELLCFLNSYSVVLVDGWLGYLDRALAEPEVGLVGASGSWESQAEWIRGRAVHWPQQLAVLPRARRDYPRFPNPHIRTSAFMLDRIALSEMGLELARDKRAAYLLESGRMSITSRVRAQGMRAVVVGRDGRVYDVEEWPASRTFRSGDQENLLIADNQTRSYQMAPARDRRRFSRDSWGADQQAVGRVTGSRRASS